MPIRKGALRLTAALGLAAVNFVTPWRRRLKRSAPR